MFAFSDSGEDDLDLVSPTPDTVTPSSPTPLTSTPPSPTPPTPTPPQFSYKSPSATPPNLCPEFPDKLWTEMETDEHQSFQSFQKVDKMTGISECSNIRIDFLDIR